MSPLTTPITGFRSPSSPIPFQPIKKEIDPHVKIKLDTLMSLSGTKRFASLLYTLTQFSSLPNYRGTTLDGLVLFCGQDNNDIFSMDEALIVRSSHPHLHDKTVYVKGYDPKKNLYVVSEKDSPDSLIKIDSKYLYTRSLYSNNLLLNFESLSHYIDSYRNRQVNYMAISPYYSSPTLDAAPLKMVEFLEQLHRQSVQASPPTEKVSPLPIFGNLHLQSSAMHTSTLVHINSDKSARKKVNRTLATIMSYEPSTHKFELKCEGALKSQVRNEHDVIEKADFKSLYDI